MPWQLAIGLSILAGATMTLIKRRYALRSSVPETFPSAVSYLCGVMPVGIVIGLSLPHRIYWSGWLGFLLLLCASSMAVGSWISFRAVKLLPVAAYQTIGCFTNVVAIALGWVVLGEGLSPLQLGGTAILLLAAVLASLAPAKDLKTLEHGIHTRAVLLTLLACTAIAVSLVTEKGVLGHATVGGVLLAGWGSQTFAMLLLALKDVNRANVRAFRPKEIKWSVLIGLANGTGGAFYVYALQRSNNVSLIIALTAISLPLTVLGAHALLGERDNNKLMWLGLSLGFAGLLLTAL
jgi:drug/metabolite transporter (DMT)-like permease